MAPVQCKERLQARAQEEMLLLHIRWRQSGVIGVVGEVHRDAACDEGGEAEVGGG
jgi:hypothetical protein